MIARSALREQRNLWCLYTFIGCGAIFVMSVLGLQVLAWSQAAKDSDVAFDVLAASNRVLHGLENAELGQRNYLLTKDSAYVRIFEQGVLDTEKAFEDLSRATKDDVESEPLMAVLTMAKNRHIAELRTTVVFAQQERLDGKLLALRTIDENQYRNNFLEAVHQLLVYWRQRHARVGHDLNWLQRSCMATMVGASGLLLLTLVVTATMQRRSFQEIVDASTRLDAEVMEDALTGLSNRRHLLQALDRQIDSRASTGGALLYMDVDGFKAVNDALGHDAGDDVLRQIAAILRRSAHSSDLTVRVGGDEFVIFIPVRASEDFLKTIATRLIDEVGALGEKISGERIPLGLSIGISHWQEGGTSAANHLRCADAAMYVAKRTGKNRYHFDQLSEYLAEVHLADVNGMEARSSQTADLTVSR